MFIVILKTSMMENIPDFAILWANILILLLLFAKFAAKPLIAFLKGRKKKQSKELANLEMKKETILGEIKDINKTLNEKQAGLESTKEHIIKQAEKKLFDNIKEAENESNLILERAKQKTENRIMHETEKFYKEIRSEILPENRDKIVDKALSDTSDYINEDD